MFFHVVLTTECNLQCKYCFGENMEDFDQDFGEFDVDYSLPKKANYTWESLAKFCSNDPNCVVTFYGGEPLLCANEIRQIMDVTEPKHFMIQTNGLLLDKLEPEYVNRFHTILVSIDGDEALTDYYRGKGTFRKLVNNLEWIMRNGFQGELIARMTVMEQTDIYKQVMWLLNNSEFSFSGVHWQLNAGFWGNDYARRDFKGWSERSYLPGLERLARFWVEQMEANGTVQRLYPFVGIADSLLKEEPTLLRCGGGWINYAIQTDGFIIPCPTMWGMKDYYLGHIRDADPLRLKKIFIDDEPCTACDVSEVCGGRCLYAIITKRWKSDEYAAVCSTVKGTVRIVGKQLSKIKQLAANGRVNLSDFEFLKYNGCEIIP